MINTDKSINVNDLNNEHYAIKVSEIFYSIQGEGVTIGVPSVFLRTAICNLSCSWCDTKYTWDWANYNYESEVKDMKLLDIYNILSQFPTQNLVVTGGEPLIQQKCLAPLFMKLKKENYHIEIETNGTILPIEILDNIVDQWNVSPKLTNSGIVKGNRVIDSCYRHFSKNNRAYFKFVVQTPSDIEEIDSLVLEYKIDKHRVLLMPEATTSGRMLDGARWLAEACKQNGYRLSLRLHVLLWREMKGK